ncbi:Crp/Fnr family transcriptional regulator [Flavobacterium phragmitis]|uniref:cAMP-binding domain of CRP or a regulatory subunit of cAMP-dependent protein kinases n=1 Tax=Flavobacterium phragmitis TaxID=739143 RepID=A0A1I1UBQ9_9FLAO|nr:Crp/Fnr family transcriptional regulator [Flavobacterium phragmitis]SFD67008.1 cAMP-binding domain of CRP or a regulatory subunit of cAMP-dependent protein kinases [Flavobacterium phragmitis]
MDKFIEYILQFGNLNKQQIDLIRSKGTEIDLSRDEYYWEAGKTVKQIGFLTDGVIRVYYYNNKGEEITRYFIDENHLILSGNTIDEVYTPSEYLSAITDCNLVVFTRKDWREILDTIIGWDSIVQKIITKHHNEKIARRSELVSQDGAERYLDFIQKFPTLVNRVPLSYIASYLGITQSSLSRIRKNVR